MKCYQLKEGKGLKSLEWRDLQQRMALLDILSVVRNSFEKNGFAVTPTVYFDKSVPEAEVTELSGFVVKMKGKVVTDRNAVGLTHIVYPFGPNGDPDDGEVCLPHASLQDWLFFLRGSINALAGHVSFLQCTLVHIILSTGTCL